LPSPGVAAPGTDSLARLGDCPDAAWIVEGGKIARILAEVGRADHPVHDLGATGLGQVGREEHALGLERCAKQEPGPHGAMSEGDRIEGLTLLREGLPLGRRSGRH